MVLTAKKGGQRLQWWLVFLAGLMPLVLLAYQVFANTLGPDPVNAVLEELGRWGMYFLWMTLAVTPLRKLFKLNRLIRYRRMLGLYAFFYSCLHVLTFLTFIVAWQWPLITEEIRERPYITVGFAAFCLLIPLAVTSPKIMMRKLGRYWQRLHRLVYLCALLVLLHFWWQLRADLKEGVVFAGLLVLLFLLRSQKIKLFFTK